MVTLLTKTRQKFPISLQERESQPIDLEIKSPSPFSATFQVIFKTLQGSVSRLTVEVKVRLRSSYLCAKPAFIQDKVRPGGVYFYDILLENLGEAPIQNLVAVVSPNTTFSTVSFSTSADLSEPIGLVRRHGKASVTVSAAVPMKSSGSQTVMTGELTVSSSAGEVVVPLSLDVSADQSELSVTVKDELTFLREDKPLVSGVTITLSNPVTGFSSTQTSNSQGKRS